MGPLKIGELGCKILNVQETFHYYPVSFTIPGCRWIVFPDFNPCLWNHTWNSGTKKRSRSSF